MSGKVVALHRVVVRLLVDNGDAKFELEAFAQGGDLGPTALCELRAYALGPIVTRRTEGVHAIIKQWQGKKTRADPSLLNSLLKRQELADLLRDQAFFVFACQMYYKRNLARDLLAFTMPRKEIWKVPWGWNAFGGRQKSARGRDSRGLLVSPLCLL